MTTVAEAIEERSAKLADINTRITATYNVIQVEGGFDKANPDIVQEYEDAVEQADTLSIELENLETRGRLT